MNSNLIAGIAIVNLALFFYTVAFVLEQRSRIASQKVLTFLTLGVTLDITATIFMVIGSSHSFISSHGLLGYSSLLAMFTDCLLMWRQFRLKGANAPIGRGLNIYTRVAYIWWVAAYFAGAAIVSMR